MIDVTDDTFEAEVLEKSKTTPVVVDLWAEWCGPCKVLGPILEKAIGATNGQVVGVKVNVEENPQLNQAFQVQSIPAVFAMVNGAIVDGFVGAQPEPVVAEFVDRLLEAGTNSSADDVVIGQPGELVDEAEVEDETPAGPTPEQDLAEVRLAELLPIVKGDDDARVEFLELLELLGPSHENTANWRKKLSTVLY